MFHIEVHNIGPLNILQYPSLGIGLQKVWGSQLQEELQLPPSQFVLSAGVEMDLKMKIPTRDRHRLFSTTTLNFEDIFPTAFFSRLSLLRTFIAIFLVCLLKNTLARSLSLLTLWTSYLFRQFYKNLSALTLSLRFLLHHAELRSSSYISSASFRIHLSSRALSVRFLSDLYSAISHFAWSSKFYINISVLALVCAVSTVASVCWVRAFSLHLFLTPIERQTSCSCGGYLRISIMLLLLRINISVDPL